MRRALAWLDPWAPPLALMALIWFFSDQPNLSSGLGLADLIGRKLIHAAEYALLCWLCWRALATRLGATSAILGAFAIAAGYGAIDEYHQTFVPGRTGSPIDVGIDATGAAIAALLIRRRLTALSAASPEPVRDDSGPSRRPARASRAP